MSLPAFSHQPETTREEPRLRIVPEYQPAPRRRRPNVVPLLLILALIVGGVSVFAWQHGQVSSKARALTTANRQLSVLAGTMAGLQQQAASLQGRVAAAAATEARLNAQIDTLLARGKASTAQISSLRGQLTTAQGQLTTAQDQLAWTQQQLLTMAGPALADGRYVGEMRAASAHSTPARVAMWVTSTFAGTAIANPGWRLLAVSTDLKLRLLGWMGTTRVLSFGTFARMFNSGYAQNAPLRTIPYWITVHAGTVTAAGEYRAP